MCQMTPCEIVSFVTAVACSIAKCCDQEEIEIMAAVFVQLGDTLGTIAIQQSIVCNQNKKEEEVPEVLQ